MGVFTYKRLPNCFEENADFVTNYTHNRLYKSWTLQPKSFSYLRCHIFVLKMGSFSFFLILKKSLVDLVSSPPPWTASILRHPLRSSSSLPHSLTLNKWCCKSASNTQKEWNKSDLHNRCAHFRINNDGFVFFLTQKFLLSPSWNFFRNKVSSRVYQENQVIKETRPA